MKNSIIRFFSIFFLWIIGQSIISEVNFVDLKFIFVLALAYAIIIEIFLIMRG